jgi:hypothetical protein
VSEAHTGIVLQCSVQTCCLKVCCFVKVCQYGAATASPHLLTQTLQSYSSSCPPVSPLPPWRLISESHPCKFLDSLWASALSACMTCHPVMPTPLPARAFPCSHKHCMLTHCAAPLCPPPSLPLPLYPEPCRLVGSLWRGAARLLCRGHHKLGEPLGRQAHHTRWVMNKGHAYVDHRVWVGGWVWVEGVSPSGWEEGGAQQQA